PPSAPEKPATLTVLPSPVPPARAEKSRTLDTLTSRLVVLPVVLLSGVLLVWSLGIRWPESKHALAVKARMLPTPEATPTKIHSQEEIGEMRQRVANLALVLIRKNDEFAPILARLEDKAHQLGWRAEITMKPGVAQPGGLKELSLRPVAIQLEDEAEQPAPA